MIKKALINKNDKSYLCPYCQKKHRLGTKFTAYDYNIEEYFVSCGNTTILSKIKWRKHAAINGDKWVDIEYYSPLELVAERYK